MDHLRSGVVGVYAVVDGRDKGTVLDGEGGDLGTPRGWDGGNIVRDGILRREGMITLMGCVRSGGQCRGGRERIVHSRETE